LNRKDNAAAAAGGSQGAERDLAGAIIPRFDADKFE